MVAIFIVCLLLLFKVADMVFEDKSIVFDTRVFAMIAPYITTSNTRLAEIITFFGSPMFLLPANILLVGIFLFIKQHRWYSVMIAAVALTSTGVMFLLKEILQRERPLLPVIAKVHGYSFPSGHSFSSLVFFGMLSYIIYKTIPGKTVRLLLIISCFAFAILIGLSRVYLKVHYASDVIAGFCLGFIWLVLGRWILIKTEKVQSAASGVVDQTDRP